ncbi:AMP-binding protein [Streptomyces marincola]|uniref:AMP-binding protein n=1 Tax=Streptomyces marincola TaxID=2878388 RepID=UPI001CF55121|nr:AMP-binding protein [Streptomyces marincola]UCM88601.1 AMP-binding protein [Streptomyces marincola]
MSGDQGGRNGGPGEGTGPADVLSHGQLLWESERAAGALARLGVRAGDTVPVLLPMCLESVIVTLACAQLSATRVSLPVSNQHGLLRHRLGGSAVPLVITADACRTRGRVIGTKAALDRALAGRPDIHTVLVVPQTPRPVPWQPGRDRWWYEALAPVRLPSRPYPGGMSDMSRPGRTQPDTGRALDFDDPLTRRAPDDSDQGWGDLPPGEAEAGNLARLLREKPPHHL